MCNIQDQYLYSGCYLKVVQNTIWFNFSWPFTNCVLHIDAIGIKAIGVIKTFILSKQV